MSVAAVQRFQIENPIRTIHVQKPKGMNYPPEVHNLISFGTDWITGQGRTTALTWSSNVEDKDFRKIVVEQPIPREVLNAISYALTEPGIKKSKGDCGISPEDAMVGLLFVAENFENFAVNQLFRDLEFNNKNFVNLLFLSSCFLVFVFCR